MVWNRRENHVLIQSAPVKHSPDGASCAEPIVIWPCQIQAICPVSALQSYLDRTQSKRDKLDRILGTRSIWDHRLFISSKGSPRCIVPSTIGARLTEFLKEAGINGFTGESFRHAGASRAIRDGAPADTVARRGRWLSLETMQKFYVRTHGLHNRQLRNIHPSADIFSSIIDEDLQSVRLGTLNPHTEPV